MSVVDVLKMVFFISTDVSNTHRWHHFGLVSKISKLFSFLLPNIHLLKRTNEKFNLLFIDVTIENFADSLEKTPLQFSLTVSVNIFIENLFFNVYQNCRRLSLSFVLKNSQIFDIAVKSTIDFSSVLFYLNHVPGVYSSKVTLVYEVFDGMFMLFLLWCTTVKQQPKTGREERSNKVKS